MSYNIDTWKTKKLKGLKIPLKALSEVPDMEIKLGYSELGVRLEAYGPTECFSLEGIVKDELVEITKIENYGEGSGNFYYDSLLDLLEKTKGELEVVMVWEGGDSISRLKVKDGVIEEAQIEL